MENYNKAFFQKLLTVLAVGGLLFGNIDAFANTLVNVETNNLLNEPILSQIENNRLKEMARRKHIENLTDKYTKSYEGITSDNFTDKIAMRKEIDNFKRLNNLEILSIKNNIVNSNTKITKEGNKTAKQINKIVHKYIANHFGSDANIFTLNDNQKNQLEDFVDSSEKISKLYQIIENNRNVGIKTEDMLLAIFHSM